MIAAPASASCGSAHAAWPSTDAFRRGAIVRVSRGPWLRRAARRGCGFRHLSVEEETRHFKLIGTTGAGKSTAIAALLRAALARGDRAMIADPNGAYLARFFDRYRGDVLLNPFEPHSARWDPFAEARRPYDYEELARALVPQCGDAAGREWRGYARTLIAALARRCGESGERDLGTLWRLLGSAGADEIRRRVAGTPAQPFLDADNSRMFGSIRSVAISALAALQHIEAQRGRAFSVREWTAGGRGVLFIPYRASQIAALRSIIATWMRLAIFETLSLPQAAPGTCGDPYRRLWFVVDELDALGAIDGLKDALARLRKFGGRCVLGFQSIAQVRGTYGDAEAQTIVENCGNTLILRCSASERGGTAEFASRLIGQREIIRPHVTESRPIHFGGGAHATRTSGQQYVVENAVLASEIEQLPDLSGFLKLAAQPEWRRVSLSHQ
jgi:type IV secretory pathway TraG/TraD family ATPase VirD4